MAEISDQIVLHKGNDHKEDKEDMEDKEGKEDLTEAHLAILETQQSI